MVGLSGMMSLDSSLDEPQLCIEVSDNTSGEMLSLNGVLVADTLTSSCDSSGIFGRASDEIEDVSLSRLG